MIGRIYDTVCDRHVWSVVLHDIARITHSKSAILLHQDHESQHLSIFSAYGIESMWQVLYHSKYGEKDPVLERLASTPTGQIVATCLAYEFHHSDIYHDFYKPQDIFHFAGVWLIKNKHSSVFLGFHRAHHMPEYEEDVLLKLKELVPHFQKALYIHQVHTQALVKSEVFASGIDMMQVGILLFDHQSRMRYCNKAAKTIIDRHPAIEMRRDMICATTHACHKRLREAMSIISSTTRSDAFSKPVAIGLTHPDAFTPLPVLLIPIHQVDFPHHIAEDSVATAMMITDPDRILCIPPEMLRTVYHLTEAEAYVALALANAKSAKKISKEKNVKMTTVRSQIQSIFSKMGVNTQAQLIKTLLNAPFA